MHREVDSELVEEHCNVREPASPLEWALAYAAAGWWVFPCNEEKRPRTTHGLLDATTDEKAIRQWWAKWPKALVGIACEPSGLVVIDLDLDEKRQKNGPEVFEQHCGARPHGAALVASTPRGGRHLYYRAPSETIKTKVEWLNAVDTRAAGGYVIAPGTAGREWIEGEPGEQDELPAWLRDDLPKRDAAAKETRTSDSKTKVEAGSASDEELQDAVQLLHRLDPRSLSRDEWLHAIWSFAAAAQRDPRGELHVEAWSSLDAARFEHGESARKYREGNGEIGAGTLHHMVREQEQERDALAAGFRREEEEEHGTSWMALSLDELLAQPPVEWLAKGLLPLRGVALLAAEPRAGKSFLALDLAMRVACGSTSFLERPVKANGGVVYAALEGVAGLAARARAWRKAHPNESEQRPLHLLRWRGEALLTDGCEEFAAELRKCVHKSGRVSLVIVDTLTLALAADENDSASVGKALRFLGDLADELGCCILVVHHVRKDGKALGQARARMSISDVRGSSALVGNVDVVLGLQFQEGRDERELLVLKSKDGEAGSPLWFELNVIETGAVLEDGSLERSCVVSACDAPFFVEPDQEEVREHREERKRQRDEQRAEELRECVIEAACELLRKHPHGLPKTAIQKRLKGRKASLLLILDEALGEGRFVQVRKGNGFVFQLPPPLKPETEQKLDEHGLVASEGAKAPEFPEVPEGSGNLQEPTGERDERTERERGSRVPVPGGNGGNTHTHATASHGGDA
jgi:hypothetical protein